MSFRLHQPTRLVVPYPNDQPLGSDAYPWMAHAGTPPSSTRGPASNDMWRSEHSASLERSAEWREGTAVLAEQSQQWNLSSREEAAVRRYSVSHDVVAEEGEKWTCKACTYDNYPGVLNCIICGTQRDSVYSPSNQERQYRILRQDLKYKWKGKLISTGDGCCHSYDRNTRASKLTYGQFFHAFCCYCVFQGQNAEFLNPKKGCRFMETYFSGWATIHCPHCCFACLFPCVHGMFIRGSVRHKFEIKGSRFNDCRLHCCCWACASIQERKQLELEWKPPELSDGVDEAGKEPGEKPCDACCKGPKSACAFCYEIACNWDDSIMADREDDDDSDGSEGGARRGHAAPLREDATDAAKRQAFLAQYHKRRGSAWVAGSRTPERQRSNSVHWEESPVNSGGGGGGGGGDASPPGVVPDEISMTR
jgi:Cys-rich protein (TIGR01571 family)